MQRVGLQDAHEADIGECGVGNEGLLYVWPIDGACLVNGSEGIRHQDKAR